MSRTHDCLNVRMHDNTYICCGVVYIGDACQYCYLLWSCHNGRMHDNTFISCGVVYIGGCMPILLYAMELPIWEEA